MPSTSTLVPLTSSYCIEVVGADSATVVNNLCTNDVSKLEVNDCCEAFVTNQRGWVVAHAFIVRLESRLLLVGQHPAPAEICEHIDRYIIREDAVVRNVTNEQAAFIALSDDLNSSLESVAKRLSRTDARVEEYEFETTRLLRFPASIIQDGQLLLCDQSVGQALQEALCTSGFRQGTPSELELQRIKNFWPAATKEILEKTLPQELDRNDDAISFTKGCYLGQETIARLDARGQVQKKMCLLKIDTITPPEPGTILVSGEKEVGSLTSVALDVDITWALATVRRGAFDVGTTLLAGTDTATVIR